MKLLVVEDEPINMLLISEVLGKMGLEVIKASNGREAIGTLAENDVSLIFMDVNMPDLDGYSATRIIRRWTEINPSRCSRPRASVTDSRVAPIRLASSWCDNFKRTSQSPLAVRWPR